MKRASVSLLSLDTVVRCDPTPTGPTGLRLDSRLYLSRTSCPSRLCGANPCVRISAVYNCVCVCVCTVERREREILINQHIILADYTGKGTLLAVTCKMGGVQGRSPAKKI
jgi:hypothetical protein